MLPFQEQFLIGLAVIEGNLERTQEIDRLGKRKGEKKEKEFAEDVQKAFCFRAADLPEGQ